MTGSASKRVVVIGGTGNISGWVVDGLVAAGHEVTVFNRGLRPRPLPDGVRSLVGDRSDREAFEQTMRAGAFDVAFDMICFTVEDAESDLRAFAGVEHLIHTSTVATLGGELAELPADESTPPRPALGYGIAKEGADEVFLAAHRERGFPVTILKPAHIWGRGMVPIRQLGFHQHWLGRLRAGKPLLVGGSGRQMWSLCHAEDAAPAYLGLMSRPEAFGESYIVTSPRPLTWVEYHEQIAAALGVEANLVHAPVDAVIAAWPEGTEFLAGMSRWDHVYDVGKLQRAVPAFAPTIGLADRIVENVRWAEDAIPAGVEDHEDEVLEALADLLVADGSDLD